MLSKLQNARPSDFDPRSARSAAKRAPVHARAAATILETLLERQIAHDRAIDDRRAALTAEIAANDEKLKGLYRAIEDGIVDLDVHLKDRIETLKTERDIAQASNASPSKPLPAQ